MALLACGALASSASAQGLPPTPLSGWRAQVDGALSELSMPRASHSAIINMMQGFEQQARQEQAMADARKRAEDEAARKRDTEKRAD